MDVCITEYNEKSFVTGILAEGRSEERLSLITRCIKQGKSKDFIISLFEATEEEYSQALQQMKWEEIIMCNLSSLCQVQIGIVGSGQIYLNVGILFQRRFTI